MNYFVKDNTPDDWFKMECSSAYLPKIDSYITSNNVNAVIRGAVMIGSLGAGTSIVAFCNEDEFKDFQRWYLSRVDKWTPCRGNYRAENQYY